MKKVLFMIHDLGSGGAEKVLVNLVNHLDITKFDVTVMALFGGGINEQFLSPNVRLINCFSRSFAGNSHFMKLFSPYQLHKFFVKEHYDIEIAYLEGASARIISGCSDRSTKTLCWIHCTMKSEHEVSIGFRSFNEAQKCYSRFDNVVFVSDGVRKAFNKYCPFVKTTSILFNTNESDKIIELSQEQDIDGMVDDDCIRLIGVGKIVANKGFDRFARIHKRLTDDGFRVHCYVLGVGDEKASIERYLEVNGLSNSFTFLGYQTNPYKYVARSNIFVCTSYAEGFSTAATEALIVGTPVCTVEVSGMKEMLGENNEYGIVTENSEAALYEGIKQMIASEKMMAYYHEKAKERGQAFSTEATVKAVEEMFDEI